MNKGYLVMLFILFTSCELLVFLRDGKPEKSDFKLYQKDFVNTSNIPRCNGIYIMEDYWDEEKFYRYYKFYDSGQVLYGNFDSLDDSVSINMKYSQKGYYQMIKKDFLKLEMFANGYRFYYFLEADINSTADTLIIRKQTMHDGSKAERMSNKYVFIDKQLIGSYPTW